MSINDLLPVELLTKIFRHLRLNDLDNCRLVCRRFMLICDQVPISEVIYWNISEAYASRKDFWYYTNKQFNYKNHIYFLDKTASGHRWTFRLNKLKRLYYNGVVENHCFWSRLSDLTHLVHLRLEINLIDFEETRVIELNLPNLERLEIGRGFHYLCELHLRAPKLSILKCFEFEAIHLADPNTIEHLELVRYTETADQLVNVKYLKVNCEAIRHRNIWSIFPELKTLVCNSFDDDGPDDFDASIQAVRDLFLRKKSQQKLYFQSVELVHCSTINEYETSKNILAFQIRNYGSLCANISHHGPLDYNELMRLTNDNLPVTFFRKYFGVRSVKIVGEVKNQDHLLGFLKRFEYLNCLEIDSCSVSQEFYNRLQENEQLTRVTVNNNSSITNHDVLSKFRYLKEFSTDQSGAHFLDLALALFREREFFAKICFNVREERILIMKEETVRKKCFYRCIRRENGSLNGCASPLTLDSLEQNLLQIISYYKNGELDSK